MSTPPQAALELENSSFRGATEALTGQIAALQAAVSDLGGKAALDPALQSAMDKLPAIVKNRAMGGGGAEPGVRRSRACRHPRTRSACSTICSRASRAGCASCSSDVERRNLLAASTPSIWPTQGWLTSRTGGRARIRSPAKPTTTRASTSRPTRARPVYATADGTVSQASYSGALRQSGRASITTSASRRATAICRRSAVKPGAGGQARRPDRPGRRHRPRHRPAPPLRSPRQRPHPQPAPVPAQQRREFG